MSYQNHLDSFADLITTYNETRAGFIAMALEKNRRANPYIEEARQLQNRIKSVSDPNNLPSIPDIRNGLIAASGISEKASGHLGVDGCTFAIQEFIKNFLIPAGDKFKEELVFRFLLTRGDSLGGSMRNIVGALAQQKLCLTITSSLKLSGFKFYILNKSVNKWISASKIDDTELQDAKAISWINNSNQHRSLYFNVTVPIVKNNIDIILLKNAHTENLKEIIKTPQNYIALGELKGGIDPAGADEHWKTAKTAIDRIRNAFNTHSCKPSILFIGAAIENKMASEIYENLVKQHINNAANLTNSGQIVSLVDWLIKL